MESSTAREKTESRGIRLTSSAWALVEAVQHREGHGSISETVRRAVDEYVERRLAKAA